MESITVNVTKKHIDEGMPSDCNQCPIALALKDQGYLNVSVDISDISFTYGPDNSTFICNETPFGVNEFIESFDEGAEVSPFSFTIERIPEEEEDPDWADPKWATLWDENDD